MELETEVTNVTNLQVGNVEKAMTTIASCECGIQSMQDEANSEIQDKIGEYEAQIRQKLPRIIGNILSLGDIINNIKKIQNQSVSVDITGIYPSISLFQNWEYSPKIVKRGLLRRKEKEVYTEPEELSNMMVKVGINTSHTQGKIQIDFLFNLDGSLNKMKMEYHPYTNTGSFQANTPNEFTERYLEHVVNELEKDKNIEITCIPYLLNHIPSAIAEFYEKKEVETKERLERLNGSISSTVEKIESLEVSDF